MNFRSKDYPMFRLIVSFLYFFDYDKFFEVVSNIRGEFIVFNGSSRSFQSLNFKNNKGIKNIPQFDISYNIFLGKLKYKIVTKENE